MTKTTCTSTTGFVVSRANGRSFHVVERKNVMLAVLALFNQHAVEVFIRDITSGKETAVKKTKDGKFYYKDVTPVNEVVANDDDVDYACPEMGESFIMVNVFSEYMIDGEYVVIGTRKEYI